MIARKLFAILLFGFLLLRCADPEEPVSDPLPEACFTSVSAATQGNVVTFDASCSKNGENYHWDFGDSEESSAKSPQHTFQASGTFAVTLTVENNGKTDTFTQQILVNAIIEETAPIFSIVVDASYWSLSEKDFWIFVNAPSGEVLDFKQVKAAGKITFETKKSLKPTRVGVTLFTKDSLSSSMIHYSFESRLSIPVDQEWQLKTPIPITAVNPPEAGECYVNYEIPAAVRMDYLSSGAGGFGGHLDGNRRICNIDLMQAMPMVLLTVAEGGNPRYKLIENVTNGQTFNVAFSDMEEYDYVLDLTFLPSKDPYGSASFEENGGSFYTYYNGFNIPPFGPSSTVTSLKIGYLNRFKTYNTYFQMSFTGLGFGFAYEKVGAVPAQFTISDHPPYEIVNRTIAGFAYTQEIDFTKRKSHFKFLNSPANTSIFWNMEAPNNPYDKIAELPTHFTDKYPFISIDKFQAGTSFFQQSTRSYQQQVDASFRGMPAEKEFERFEYGIE